MPVHDIVPGRTRKHLSLQDTAKLVKLSRYHLSQLVDRHLFPGPDVFIAPYIHGWDETRARAFAIEAELIHEDGSKYKKPTGGSKARKEDIAALVRDTYSTRLGIYLGNTLISAVYNLRGAAIYQARDREKFLPADVVISTRMGWDEWEVLRFGQQSGRIRDTDVDEWAIRRTTDHGLPVVGWVIERAEQRPLVAKALTSITEKTPDSALGLVFTGKATMDHAAGTVSVVKGEVSEFPWKVA